MRNALRHMSCIIVGLNIFLSHEFSIFPFFCWISSLHESHSWKSKWYFRSCRLPTISTCSERESSPVLASLFPTLLPGVLLQIPQPFREVRYSWSFSMSWIQSSWAIRIYGTEGLLAFPRELFRSNFTHLFIGFAILALRARQPASEPDSHFIIKYILINT